MEQVTTIFLEQGILGAVIVVLAGAVVYMSRKLDRKDKENDELHLRLVALQEAWRVSELERADRSIESLNTATQVSQALIEKIDLGRGTR